MTRRLRSWLFVLVFYGGSVPIVLAAPIAAMFGRLRFWVLLWVGFHAWSARAILGLSTRIEGAPIAGPALYAAKHQSFYETFELVRLLDAPAIVMRQEFARIPVWGWAARRYGVIVIDRAGSATALRQMLREAKAARDEGRSIVIFPEGTRTPPGCAPPLKAGFAGLYRGLGLPTIAIALDSGRFWPKKGPKRGGMVTFRFSDPFPPGLSRADVEAEVHAAINVQG